MVYATMLSTPDFANRNLLPFYFIPSYYLVIAVAIASSPSRSRILLSSSVLLVFICRLPFSTFGSAMDDCAMGCIIAYISLLFVDLIIISDSQVHFWESNINRSEKHGSNVASASWPTRLKRSFGVVLSPRGIGQPWQVKNIPPAVPVGNPLW
jgi:hypothetical protein